MASSREAYVGIDVAKARNAMAIADEGRDGEVRYLGEFDAAPESMRRLVARLAAKYDRLHFCYEAGPTGYGLQRRQLVLLLICKSRYSICRTLSDRSGRAALASLPRRRSAALKPGACGAPLRGCGA